MRQPAESADTVDRHQYERLLKEKKQLEEALAKVLVPSRIKVKSLWASLPKNDYLKTKKSTVFYREWPSDARFIQVVNHPLSIAFFVLLHLYYVRPATPTSV